MRSSNPRAHYQFKTKLCGLYQRGKCNFGESCRYAHSTSDLPTDRRFLIREVKVCYSFYEKDCAYGNKCYFRHKGDEKEQRGVGLLRDGVAHGGDGIINRSGEYIEKGNFFKTKLCINWERFGSCPYGVRCAYAHGETEVKQEYYHYAPMKVVASESSTGSLLKIGSAGANKKRQLHFLNWSIEKVGRVYGDWIE